MFMHDKFSVYYFQALWSYTCSYFQSVVCNIRNVETRQYWLDEIVLINYIVRHVVSRVKSLLDSTSGKVVVGGETDEAKKYISPTLLVDVELSDAVMKDEVCGL